MTLKHLRIFVEICRQKSVTGAARELYMSQPAVSLALRELEEYYGQQLFERISRKLFITEAGETAYQYASSILELWERWNRHLEEIPFRRKSGGSQHDDGCLLYAQYHCEGNETVSGSSDSDTGEQYRAFGGSASGK